MSPISLSGPRPGDRRKAPSPRTRCATRSSSPSKSSGSASPPLGRRAPQHARHRQLVAAGADGARRRDQRDQDRRRRRDAPQPPAAGRRRAVRDARGAAPRPDRPRHRPRPGHRPGHRRGAAPLGRPALRRGLPAAARRADRLLRGRFGEENPHRGITAVPGKGPKPQIWLLGSSDYSAQLAAEMGLPFSFAHHFSPRNTVPALQLYKAMFQPSEYLDRPYAMVACAVICAEDDEKAPAGSPAPRGSPSPPAGETPGPLPDARAGRRPRVHGPAGGLGGPGLGLGRHRRAGEGQGRPRAARREVRRRRADADDDGPARPATAAASYGWSPVMDLRLRPAPAAQPALSGLLGQESQPGGSAVFALGLASSASRSGESLSAGDRRRDDRRRHYDRDQQRELGLGGGNAGIRRR